MNNNHSIRNSVAIQVEVQTHPSQLRCSLVAPTRAKKKNGKIKEQKENGAEIVMENNGRVGTAVEGEESCN